MARHPKGYKKCLDLLNCGNELISEQGKRGSRNYIYASAQKVGDTYTLTMGDSKVTTSDVKQFMQDLRDFAEFTNWLAIEPEDKHIVQERKVQVLTLDLSEHKKKGRR